ncbi:MAG: chain length determinant protein EpsF, partial [Burkholderiales bacterium]
MNLSQFLAILRARWWIGAIVFALTVATTLVVSLLLPKKYAATATLLVDVKSPDPIAGMLFPSLGMPSYMATQVDIMQADRVSLRVIKMLKLNENPQIREQWIESTGGTGNFEGWLASSLVKDLSAKPSRESNVINVTYAGRDPAFSAAMANAYVQAFLDTSVELRVDPARQYSTFFDSRGKELRDAVEKAQTRLSTFQRENNLVANDERMDVETQRLNELSSQLVMTQAAAADSRSRMAQANSGSGDKMQEVLNSGVVAALKTDISRSEAQLQVLKARFGDNHPQVIEAKANIAELRARMEAEIRRVTSGVGVSNTIMKSREGDIRAALDTQRAKVLKLKT